MYSDFLKAIYKSNFVKMISKASVGRQNVHEFPLGAFSVSQFVHYKTCLTRRFDKKTREKKLKVFQETVEKYLSYGSSRLF